jgi:hypothetical protein
VLFCLCAQDYGLQELACFATLCCCALEAVKFLIAIVLAINNNGREACCKALVFAALHALLDVSAAEAALTCCCLGDVLSSDALSHAAVPHHF